MAYTSEIDKLERRHREHPEGRTFAPLADAYRKAGDIPRALEVLKAGLQHHPDYLSASIVLGRCHLDLGDLAGAEGAFRRVLELDKENVIAIKALADITERQARFDESEHWLNYLLSIDSSNEEARLQLGRLDSIRDQHSRLSTPLDPPSEEAIEAGAPPAPSADAETIEIPPVAVAAAATPEEARLPSFSDADADAAFEESAPPPVPPPSPPAWREPEPEPEEDLEPVLEQAPDEGEEPFRVVQESRDRDESPDFVRQEDPMSLPSRAGGDFEVGVERHEEIVLRPSSSSEFQPPSDSEILSSRMSEEYRTRFEEDSPAPGAGAPEPVTERVSALSSEDLWQAHPEDAAIPELEIAEPAAAPDDAAPEDAPAEPVPAGPGRPVGLGGSLVTETIGDVYAAQGHHAEALDVYRQVLQRSPDDARLSEKIEELERRHSQPVAPPSAGPADRRFAATHTGGQSVLSYFGDLLSARLPETNGPASAGAVAPAPGDSDTAFMEEAFRTDEDLGGEPTRPASGPLSLSAIFGEDSSPVPPVVAGPELEARAQPSKFDEFFGEEGATGRARSVRLSDQDDLDQFHKWLKGLKR